MISEYNSPMDGVSTEPFVSIKELKVEFHGGRQKVQAVNGVNLSLESGEVLGLLGESGSGKSVTLRALLRILPPRRSTTTGSVMVDGRDVLAMSDAELTQYRGGLASMIFQEPALALDPVYRVGDQIVECIVQHTKIGRKAARARALELLELVKIPSANTRLNAYPHEMSGGMLQRVMIALALSCSPKLLLVGGFLGLRGLLSRFRLLGLELLETLCHFGHLLAQQAKLVPGAGPRRLYRCQT